MRFRFILNFVVLIIFGLAIFGVTSTINLIASLDDNEQHEFSFVKRTADEHWGDKNYEAAGHYYKQLVESDPLNGSAHAAFSHSMKMQIEVCLRRLRRALNERDEATIVELRTQLEQLTTDAAKAYKNALAFPQFRNYSRINLALLEGYAGNLDVAVEYVVKFVDDGGELTKHVKIFDLYQCSDVLEQPQTSSLY